ncbi:hypothetical protein NDU88_005677 [Pleurodeles waltl]|uniref:Reverse transcriptase/retrotransposon-derived protein RNase H-like domain-containing protein n=1 Tax=Pleurodeles waltl TaxID=8319 RepID=A0AAV7WC67_PLEWA|nr:hypothetical protein NDU88_005677 [Pleurodeles waltl]
MLKGEQDQALQKLKTAFASTLILRHPGIRRLIAAETDASSFALKAVLHEQDAKIQALNPVATEKNDITDDREPRAIKEAFSY